jgi:hypothetical protein
LGWDGKTNPDLLTSHSFWVKSPAVLGRVLTIRTLILAPPKYSRSKLKEAAARAYGAAANAVNAMPDKA